MIDVFPVRFPKDFALLRGRACLKPVHARPAGLAKISSPARPWPGRACSEKKPEKPVDARMPGRA